MEVSGDDIATVVLEQFEKLPAKRKPQVRGPGVREWVPLSGIVAQGVGKLLQTRDITGMKCLPQNKISQAQGLALHDWHAEILAIRSFNRLLLEECHALAVSEKKTSEYVRFREADELTESHFQPFALRDGIDLHMYCSEAPCGDSSMELTMAAQDDSSPWDVPPTIQSQDIEASTEAEAILYGRGYFSELGIVRRKPSRPDAPPTLSKSCSDKIALKQSTSLLSSIVSLLISPQNLYLSSLVLPVSQYSPSGCTRAFSSSGRLQSLNSLPEQWGGGYRFHPFEIKTTGREFAYSRRASPSAVGGDANGEVRYVSSNLAASWTANGRDETIIGGVLQGRKQFDPRGASRMCKRRMWKLAMEVAGLVAVEGGVRMGLEMKRYKDVKEGEALKWRRNVKEDVKATSLKGWVKNGGEEFGAIGVEY
ncbi:hypothetical protein BP6252_04777 [Coleophoma cylindrospora]|uniref:A to I editase domain-containing protein n=1 Tax=Coleophoma cylindrospora TaxID=1849047 RepID=A0A3D8S1G8_9HELO|nr:hypothetical protein BP6252_04777 [Coleophoma cylindrospora]